SAAETFLTTEVESTHEFALRRPAQSAHKGRPPRWHSAHRRRAISGLQPDDMEEADMEGKEAPVHGQSSAYGVTLASIGDGVITTDVEGRVTLLNPVAERL